MKRYIDADEFVKYVKDNYPYLYTMVAMMVAMMPKVTIDDKDGDPNEI